MVKTNRVIRSLGLLLAFLGLVVNGQQDSIHVEGFCISDKYASFLFDSDSLIKSLFTFCVETEDSIVAITFDDGPGYNNKQLTTILKNQDCPATFFLITEKLTETVLPSYINPLFSLGIHGFEHVRLTETSQDTLERELRESVRRFESLHLPVKYYRPAYGAFNSEVIYEMEKYNLNGILWNVDSYDWLGLEGEELLVRIMECVRPGSILMFHEKTKIEDILKVIITLREKGYRIVSMDELLKYPKCLAP